MLFRRLRYEKGARSRPRAEEDSTTREAEPVARLFLPSNARQRRDFSHPAPAADPTASVPPAHPASAARARRNDDNGLRLCDPFTRIGHTSVERHRLPDARRPHQTRRGAAQDAPYQMTAINGSHWSFLPAQNMLSISAAGAIS